MSPLLCIIGYLALLISRAKFIDDAELGALAKKKEFVPLSAESGRVT